MDRAELDRIGARERAAQRPIRFRCCTAAGCLPLNCSGVINSLESRITARRLNDRMEVVRVGCLRLCCEGPLVQVDPTDRLHFCVQPENIDTLISSVEIAQLPDTGCDPASHPFFAKQQPVVLENCGRIDPGRIESAIAAGGYQSLAAALLEMSPAEVIDTVTKSGLRGRGGAGYHTGLKWSQVAAAKGQRKFVVCNADEGDPGAFKDRTVLESDPHRVLEGIIIAGYAVGAQKGYIYIRGEYELAIERLEPALKQARKIGLLGRRIFGSPFSFQVEIRIGAGAYVCGEETALMASIEGRRGQPRPRPPYPSESGLWGCPTLINNTETLATIAPILRRGADAYSALGVGRSRGTKVFSLSGHVRNTGLIEVPMGTPVRQVVEEMGGGAFEGKSVKAVQTGGPAGGFVPAHLLDTPIDYESMAAIGSIVGSGGMVVLDSSTDMVDMARFFMDFCRDESCGKCLPCRAGTVQLHTLLDRLQRSEGDAADLRRLEELSDMVKHTSLCGLGQSAPNPVLGSLRYFRDEYETKLKGNPSAVFEPVEEKPSSNSRPPAPGSRDSEILIDDQPVRLAKGQTLLEAAQSAGIHIPTLCHVDGLSDMAACRLCLVEIEGQPKLGPACVTMAEEGMIVRTQTNRLRSYRRMILELFFAERNHVCAVCVANKQCELQDLAVEHGMDHVRFDYRFPEHHVDLSHKLFGLDHNRCILCTRCVRVCDEVEGAHTWDVAGRGEHSWVITDMNEPWGQSTTCTSCGKCVAMCPTGALFPKGTEVAGLKHSPRTRNRIELLMVARERHEWHA
jgi:bidirectional [NiFe] hydrogenase diaphorase subunit